MSEDISIYFFDTYALFELIKGSERYQGYSKNTTIVTTKLNLMELHYTLLRTAGKTEADKAFAELVTFCVEYTDEVIKKANQLKLLYRKRKLSYVDCLGYLIARMRGIPFLTGDEQFADLDNVEFVK